MPGKAKVVRARPYGAIQVYVPEGDAKFWADVERAAKKAKLSRSQFITQAVKEKMAASTA